VKRCRLDPNAAGVLVLDLPDRDSVRRAALRLESDGDLIVQLQAGRAQRLRVTVADDDMLGPAIGFGPGGRDRLRDAVIELPPLNLALAAGLIARSPAATLLAAGQGHGAADLDAVADALVRVSQLVIDVPEIAALIIDPLFADEAGVSAAEAWISLRPDGESGLTAIAPYPADLVEQWRTKTGEMLEVRPIRPEDAEAHAGLMSRLTAEDIRYRFFSLLRELPPEQIARMTAIDYDREMAIIAVRGGSQTVGVARLVQETGGSEAEFAVLVDPATKGTGLGQHLMHRIIDWGRRKGLAGINGQILADNARMLAFIRKLGFSVHRIPGETDVLEARLAL
jgi:acetyltransferase